MSAALAIEEEAGCLLVLRGDADGRAWAVALGGTWLDLDDPDLPFQAWQEVGRRLGDIDRASRWWLGDWLLRGEILYGEDAAQGVDDLHSRYDLALRVTGLDQGTLMNVSSVCRRVPRSRRREELGFWIHAEVAALEPEEQVEWLDRAVVNRWTRNELRDAIRGRAREDPEPGWMGDSLTRAERLEAAARLVWRQGRADGAVATVPIEAWRRLGAALGEEER